MPHHKKWFQPEIRETTERREQEAEDGTSTDLPRRRESIGEEHLWHLHFNDIQTTEGRLGCTDPFRTSETCESTYQLPVVF